MKLIIGIYIPNACEVDHNSDVYFCTQGSSLWWTATTGREWTRRGRSWPECSLRTNSETPCCSFSQINRWGHICVSSDVKRVLTLLWIDVEVSVFVTRTVTIIMDLVHIYYQTKWPWSFLMISILPVVFTWKCHQHFSSMMPEYLAGFYLLLEDLVAAPECVVVCGIIYIFSHSNSTVWILG